MKIPQEFKNAIPPRKPDTHKGDYGHVFILAGSVGLTGAAALCSRAALMCGAGLATLGIPESLNDIMEVKLTEVMTKPLPETSAKSLSPTALKEILEFSETADVLAIGPGLSKNLQTQRLVQEIIVSVAKPMVIDADGVNALVGKLDILLKARAPLVLTPHPGEMARLLGARTEVIQKQRIRVAVDFTRRRRAILVLKGHNSVVAGPDGKFYVNKSGNPGMATAGVGDVLTGMIAALIAQGMGPFSAARLAVYLHGLAGDIAAAEKTQTCLIASDVLKKLPEAIKKL